MRYHESKGLRVVDYRHCVEDEPTAFVDRYKCVLNAINDSSKFSVKGKDEIEAFELLYDLLAPLDKMESLRIQDIKEKLHNKVIIESHGVINISVGENILFKHFVAINDMSEDDREKLNVDTLQKYQLLSPCFQRHRSEGFTVPIISSGLFLMTILFLAIRVVCNLIMLKCMSMWLRNMMITKIIIERRTI